MPRYRYITSGLTTLDSPVYNFLLLPGNMLSAAKKAIRITIPDNMELIKQHHPPCSITFDDRTLHDLDAMPIVKIMGHWREAPALDKAPLYRWDKMLAELGYYPVSDQAIGYMPQARWYKYQQEKIDGTHEIASM